jgi:4-amino-4-deoxy-L-arabinose transferase-like glycosyltransferase
MDVVFALVVFLLLGVIMIVTMARFIAPDDRAWLIRVLLIAFLLRIAMATMFASFPSTRMFHEDAEGYEVFGMALAQSWSGRAPPIPIHTLETNFGYTYFCGGIYYVIGQARAAASYFNCTLGVATIALVYSLARRFFVIDVARRAALLCAFIPSMILWSAMALKDTPMTFLIVLALASCIRLKQRFSLLALLGTVLPVLAMQPIRFYMVYFVGFAIVASLLFERSNRFLTGLPKHALAIGGIVGLMVFVGILGAAERGTEIFSFERVSQFRQGMSTTANSGFAADVDISTPGRALLYMPLGITMLLFSPFPWQFASLRASFAAPEMFLWWALVPSLYRGIRYAMKRRLAEVSPILLFSLVLTLAYSLVHGNIGSGFRQRAQILVFLFIFTSLGTYVKKYRRKNMDPRTLLVPTPAEAAARQAVLAAQEAA